MPRDKLTNLCNCSMKMKVRTVFGLAFVSHHPTIDICVMTYANLSQAGVHPRMRNCGPSFRNESTIILPTLCTICQLSSGITGKLLTGLTPSTVTAFWTLLFRTSAGAQAVVATVPASSEARKWTGIPSLRPRDGLESICCLAAEYLVQGERQKPERQDIQAYVAI